MISHIGYFHFGIKHQDPIGSLNVALTASAKTVVGSLIVLPELIDIRTSYYRYDQWKDYDQTFASQLATLARKFSLIFVAGMRVPKNHGAPRFYNGSVLITPARPVILHLKTECDVPQHIDRYEGLLETNPTTIDNILLGSVICADANRPMCQRNPISGPETIFRRFEKNDRQNQRTRVIGIPAFMSKRSDFFGLDSGHLNETKWRGYYIVLANSRSDPIGHESFIAAPNGDVVKSSVGKKNEISTHPILEAY